MEKGQSLVELALMLPFLILLLAVVIDAGRLFDAAIVLVQAAREGAERRRRRGAGRGPATGVAVQPWRVQDTLIKEELNDFGERNGAEDTGGVLGDADNTSVAGVYLDEHLQPVHGGVIGSGSVPANAIGVEATVYLTTPTFFGGIMGRSNYPVQAQAAVLLDIACGTDCIVLIATHMDTITTTPGCFNIFNGDGPGNSGWLNWSAQGIFCGQNECSAPCLEENLSPGSCRPARRRRGVAPGARIRRPAA